VGAEQGPRGEAKRDRLGSEEERAQGEAQDEVQQGGPDQPDGEEQRHRRAQSGERLADQAKQQPQVEPDPGRPAQPLAPPRGVGRVAGEHPVRHAEHHLGEPAHGEQVKGRGPEATEPGRKPERWPERERGAQQEPQQ